MDKVNKEIKDEWQKFEKVYLKNIEKMQKCIDQQCKAEKKHLELLAQQNLMEINKKPNETIKQWEKRIKDLANKTNKSKETLDMLTCKYNNCKSGIKADIEGAIYWMEKGCKEGYKDCKIVKEAKKIANKKEITLEDYIKFYNLTVNPKYLK